MCDTENRFAKSRISLDNLGIDHHFAVNGNELYSTPPISDPRIGHTLRTADAPLNGNNLDQCELVTALSGDHLMDLSAQKQIAATGQAMQLTDGQLNSSTVCDGEIVNGSLGASALLGAMHGNVANSPPFAADHQNSQNGPSAGKQIVKPDGAAGSGQESLPEPVAASPANASLANSAGNHLVPSNDGGTRCAMQCGANGATNGTDTGSGMNRFAASTKSNEPSSTESVSPTSKSTESSPAETPKRLHVSNIPFKYHDEHLRQLFSVSFAALQEERAPIKCSGKCGVNFVLMALIFWF